MSEEKPKELPAPEQSEDTYEAPEPRFKIEEWRARDEAIGHRDWKAVLEDRMAALRGQLMAWDFLIRKYESKLELLSVIGEEREQKLQSRAVDEARKEFADAFAELSALDQMKDRGHAAAFRWLTVVTAIVALANLAWSIAKEIWK